MSIVFDENLDLFRLETANTSYIMQTTGPL